MRGPRTAAAASSTTIATGSGFRNSPTSCANHQRAIAGALMGSRKVQIFHDHVLVKESATPKPTPWHQDMPYYCVDGMQTASYWIPLDPVSEDNTLRLVLGSHLMKVAGFESRLDRHGAVAGRHDEPDLDGNPTCRERS
jgi:ectoine hydroxylase-related dioxygenase (phytanoyl-CoA dioxygenase family)